MVTNIEIRELSPWQFSFFINNYITKGAITMAKEETRKVDTGIVVNGRFCPQSVRSFCPVVAGFNAGTYKVPACVL